jgi:hypothetical protein
MEARGREGPLVVGGAPGLQAALRELAAAGRLVFFAGLPGTGKSLLIHQLAHLAHAAGRHVHLLQWDVARPPFEASGPGRRYPQEDGVTHGLIRLAVGRWARQALPRWDREHAAASHLLIGETPLVGHRLVELARPAADAAEALLAAETTRFVVPVPSRAVRRHLEAERARRAVRPLHARETEDAPPEVLRDLWRQLAAVARTLGVGAAPAPPAPPGDDPPYDPETYARVYLHVLARRRARAIPVDTVLATGALSVYDFRIPTRDLVPTPDEAAAAVRAVEASHRDPASLQRQIDRWWDVAPADPEAPGAERP